MLKTNFFNWSLVTSFFMTTGGIHLGFLSMGLQFFSDAYQEACSIPGPVGWFHNLLAGLLMKAVNWSIGISSFCFSFLVFRFLAVVVGLYLWRKTLINFYHGSLLACSESVELRAEVVAEQVVMAGQLPSFDIEVPQPPRSILECRPFIKIATVLGDFEVPEPIFGIFTQEYQRGTYFKNFYLSLPLLSECLNEKTLLASNRETDSYVKRIFRFAESASHCQDSFAEFLRGRDAFRETIHFCLSRAVNMSCVNQLYQTTPNF